MSKQKDDGQKDPSKNPNQNSSNERDIESNDKGKQESMVPQKTFDGVYARLKAAEEALEKIEAEKKKEAEERMKKNNEFEALLSTKENEIKSLTERLSRYEEERTGLEEIASELVSQIPEDRRKLVPESLPSIEKIKYVNSNREFLFGDIQTKKLGNQTPKGDKEPLNDIDKKKARFEELREKVRRNDFLTVPERKELAILGREIAKSS